MGRRPHVVNIPTDIIRSIVYIVETGSFGKAAERLGISRPAISAQIRKLQVLVGGAMFERTTGGVELSERGKLLMPLLRKMLETNDQILHTGSASRCPRPARVGMSFVYGTRFLQAHASEQLRRVSVICDNSPGLLRGLVEGYHDVAAVYQPAPTAGIILRRWKENLVWIRSPDFTLRPGAPVPLIGWPDLIFDQISIKLLESSGIAYRLAFTSFERMSRLMAVRAGLGVMLVPDWSVSEGLVVAKEYYLPPLPPIEAGIVSSASADPDRIKSAVAMLEVLAQ